MHIGAGFAAVCCVLTLVFPAGTARAETVSVTATPIEHFSPTSETRTRFGRLTFLRGARLTSDNDKFGGISGMVVSPDGRSMMAVTDLGQWLSADIVVDDNNTLSLADVILAPLRDSAGGPVEGKRSSDSEGLALHPDSETRVIVSFERRNRLLSYDLSIDGFEAAGQPVAVPEGIADLPDNKGIEAIVTLPGKGADTPKIIAFAERANEDGLVQAFIVEDGGYGHFQVRTHEAFDITDATTDADGNIVILLRYFSVLTGPKVAVQRIRIDNVTDGAIIQPELLMAPDVAVEIDNMEALALHEENGRSILTMMSDDNFSPLQRTLILQFALD